MDPLMALVVGGLLAYGIVRKVGQTKRKRQKEKD